MLRVTRGVDDVKNPSATEVDDITVVCSDNAPRFDGQHRSQQGVEGASKDSTCAGFKALRIDEVSGSGRMDHDLRRRECLSHLADAASMIEVNVGDDHSREII
jgi:hypothetical protein